MHKFFAKTHFLGKKVLFLPQCHSTNEIAMSLVNNGHAPEGITIITADQTRGKGQRGNVWESEAGKNLTFSFVIKPTFLALSVQFDLHIVVSLAIYQALTPYLGHDLKIKWPNDIYYGKDKIGGILIENTVRGTAIENSIVGIGLNINQQHFQTIHANSMKNLCQRDLDIDQIAEEILIRVEKNYLQLKTGNHRLKKQYEQALYQINQLHTYQDKAAVFTGTITGISESGKLIIESQNKTLEYNFKEVTFL
ncbi:biotin--[acetyl-CoA-carboxylase] ligase [Reichenbachiella agarivorans]|uniref:Biotin--[acetyl-CoA-carboxylase] ligase n=1 Tax=Reichenbachiella agarivorans TaxID=2979464 RepID=A0ABY6CQY4_9BACT|nr:biotin--[acetyl-CoA-carboxylase] ligase [Reichenbachiella agarivorans]UXP32901.1 biotin--[acetyl-CoA-carboxylase] ligase [Reichenbachiella agarivorans]